MKNPFKRTKDVNGNTIVATVEEVMIFGMLLGIGIYAGFLKLRLWDEKTKKFRPHFCTKVELVNSMADQIEFDQRKNS